MAQFHGQHHSLERIKISTSVPSEVSFTDPFCYFRASSPRPPTLSGFTLALPTLVLPFLLPNHVLFPYRIYSSEPFFWSWEVISLLISSQANSCMGISDKKVLWYYGQCSVVSDISKTHSDNVLSHSVGSDVSLQSVFTGGLVETRGG